MSVLTQLPEAITSTIKSAMPHLHRVEAFPETVDGSAETAIYVAITGIDPGADPGDGRSCLQATFEARVRVDPSLAQASLQAVVLAAQLMDLLRCQYWNLDSVDSAKAVWAKPAGTAVDSAPKTEWTVQWQQSIYLGEEQWPWPDQPPGTLVLGFSPETGPGHEGHYQAPEQMS